jgi:glycosyltransferase involved in cell wall biosynthesis
MNIIHHTPFDFPLDAHFLGESIIIRSLIKGSQDKTHVVTSSANSVYCPSLPSSMDVAGFIASMSLDTKVHQLPYRAGEGPHVELIRELLKEDDGPVVLNYHFPGKDLDLTKKVKAEFGNDVATIVHLHCMPELLEPTYYNHSKTDKRTLKERVEEAQVDRFIAVSHAVRTAFEYGGYIAKGEIDVVQNGVDSRLYQIYSAKEKEALRDQIKIKGDRILGYVGRMNHNKGAGTILELLRYCDQADSDVGFVFATSNGNERQRFLSQLEGVAPNLVATDRAKVVLDISKLTGDHQQTNGMVYGHFYNQLKSEGISRSRAFGGIVTTPIQGALDAYFHPAQSEAICLAILEALMQGVPVIASETGGIPELVNESNGILTDLKSVEYKAPDAIKDAAYKANARVLFDQIGALDTLLRDRKIVSPGEIRTQALQKGLTTDRMQERTREIYQRAIGQ